MLIQIELSREAALVIANQDLDVSVVGPIHNQCIASVKTLSGSMVFSVAMPDVLAEELRQGVSAILNRSRDLVRSSDWDGLGLVIRLDNEVSVRRSSVREALNMKRN